MNSLRMITLLGVSMLLTSTASFAAGANQKTTELKAAKQRVAARARNEKGYPRTVLDQERLRIGNLIDDIEAGNRVDPQEIDRALERAERLR